METDQNNKINISEEELSELIKDWFAKYRNDPNKWNRNVVGITIKRELSILDNWKNAKRGNPYKGAIVKYKNKLAKENTNTENDINGDDRFNGAW